MTTTKFSVTLLLLSFLGDCRGEGACIFPLRPSAIHRDPTGSRLAIQHFTEYLQEFPDDVGVRWLLNLAYMTLGKHPAQVPAPYRMTFDHFGSECDIGRFKDIAHLVGVNRFNEAGGAILDDFHNQDYLDLVVTSFDPAQSMALYRNKGDGTFEDRTEAAGLSKQYGGFGANPLQQTIGPGQAKSVATLEIYWPTTRTTQVFHNIDINQAIEITEFASVYRRLNWTPIPLPRE